MYSNVVEVRGLRKEFGKSCAVQNLSFDIKAGEIVALLGANGAGKTTTIHMLLGLIAPTRGEIRLFGLDPDKNRLDVLRRMNFASAYQSLPYNLTVWENLLVFAEIYGVHKPKEQLEQLLETFELTELRKKTTGTLSSGEQTRVNLCKALLNNPELLLLDEPTASLDPDLADKVRRVLLSRHEDTGMTILTTSHNMIDINEMCDRVLFMQRGVVVEEGRAQDILQKYGQSSLEELFITIARQSDEERVKV